MDVNDRLDLHELAARYGNVVDSGDLDALSTIYTDDAVLTLVLPDGKQVRKDGLAAIKEYLDASGGATLHHVTNVIAGQVDGDAVLTYRVVGPSAGGRVFSGDYRARTTKTAVGWRLADLTITLRPPR
jgi:ketosteroid isomerase-like protein